MPGLAAILSLDGAPIPAGWLRAMQAAAPHRDVAAPVSLNGTCTWFDGRLDNRDDLARAFGWRTGTERTDAEYAAQAIALWAEAAPDRLIGDFVLIAFEGPTRSALLARDVVGLRPLHFARCGSLLLAASEMAQLLAVPAVDRSPDHTTVSELLAFRPPADLRTLYRHISRVPAAHVVRIAGGDCSAYRYWSPDARPTVARPSDAAHAQACRNVLETAIRARLRGERTAVFFSGGIDSSAVLSVAAHVARVDHVPSPVPLTLVFDGRPESDESEYRRAVAARVGVEPEIVRPVTCDASAILRQAQRRAWLPDLPADAASLGLQHRSSAMGIASALTGAGGDWLFGGSPLAYADAFRQGRIDRAVRRYRLDRRTEDSGWSPAGLLTAGVWPALPGALRRVLRPAARRMIGVRPPPWLRLPLSDAPPARHPGRGASLASAQIGWLLQDGWVPLGLELFEQASAESGCLVSHPLLDRRVIEFALSLPEDQRRRGVHTRFILRRAAADLLPELLLARTTKADFGHVIVSALDALGGRRLFAESRLAARGWVDPRGILAIYDRVFAGPVPSESGGASLPALWTIAAAEVWARTLP